MFSVTFQVLEERILTLERKFLNWEYPLDEEFETELKLLTGWSGDIIESIYSRLYDLRKHGRCVSE